MITRQQALNLQKKYLKKENTIKHMLALEAIMRSLAKKLEPSKEEEWGLAGLLHDLDYETIDQVSFKDHGLKTVEILKKEKVDLPQSVYQAILAHNFNHLGKDYTPKNKMDWSLFIADSLTGLIVAVTLVRPEKKLSAVTLENIQKKWKEKSFAAGTRREEITLCEEKLAIPLPEFINLSLKAMQDIAPSLGL